MNQYLQQIMSVLNHLIENTEAGTAWPICLKIRLTWSHVLLTKYLEKLPVAAKTNYFSRHWATHGFVKKDSKWESGVDSDRFTQSHWSTMQDRSEAQGF